MLQWLAGPVRPNLSQLDFGEGASRIDEPPETPAPVFAIRAFKTAIFGTPKPESKQTWEPSKPRVHEAPTKPETSVVKGANAESTKDGNKVTYEKEAENNPAVGVRLDAPASPTKGILLTPGTAATRRKTVSFSAAKGLDYKDAPRDTKAAAKEECQVGPTVAETERKASPEDIPRQSTLTRTLIELSKQKVDKRGPPKAVDLGSGKAKLSPVVNFLTDSVMDTNPDTTMDLSQPRSRSGQHWKTEYDQYHRRSSREIRRIIRYGQSVRSYAAKKDSEATALSGKLQKELGRVASMEAKVSNIAAKLKIAQCQGPEGESDQAKLVDELAQQTALAIRYKQRADAYRARSQRTEDVEATSSDKEIGDKTKRNDAGAERDREKGLTPQDQPRQAQTELESPRSTARSAEEHAMRLEEENARLKQSLARVKEEMMSYETRRQTREERLKKREAKHKAARDDCEKQLAKLTIAHEELLLASGNLPEVDMAAEIQAIEAETTLPETYGYLEPHDANIDRGISNNFSHPPQPISQRKDASISPRRRRLQKPTIDIWTQSSPREDANNSAPSKEPTSLTPSSVKHDIHRTLKEIDQNLVPQRNHSASDELEHNHQTSNTKPMPPSEPPLPAAPTPPHHAPTPPNIHDLQNQNRLLPVPSRRPSMISLASSPAKLQPGQQQQGYSKPSGATTGRSASLMSRTSTLGSRRGSALPADRAAAAKERLAKRSAEKRAKVGGR